MNIEYACEDIDILKSRYNIEKLYYNNIRRRRNLLNLMFRQSLENENIDYYRPDRVLRSQRN